ncbi:MAG: hypothetical protein [Circular genetic element sp.]|nr:MAG: hypothetical protein [Circular genetic element sp.]
MSPRSAPTARSTEPTQVTRTSVATEQRPPATRLEERLNRIEQGNARNEALTKVESHLKAAIKTEHGFTPTREQIQQAMDEFPAMFDKNPAKAFKATHADLLIEKAKGQAQAPKKSLPTMVEGKGTPKQEAEFDYTDASLSEMVKMGINRARNSQAS